MVKIPIFEWVCLKCNHKWETIRTISIFEKVRCPECMSERTKKIPSVPGYRRDHTVKP